MMRAAVASVEPAWSVTGRPSFLPAVLLVLLESVVREPIAPLRASASFVHQWSPVQCMHCC